jgi:hypothetical protein
MRSTLAYLTPAVSLDGGDHLTNLHDFPWRRSSRTATPRAIEFAFIAASCPRWSIRPEHGLDRLAQSIASPKANVMNGWRASASLRHPLAIRQISRRTGAAHPQDRVSPADDSGIDLRVTAAALALSGGLRRQVA